MRRVTLNKIASVTARLGLRRHAVLGDRIPARAGTVIAARILTSKTTYNKLEDVHGRQVDLRPGDLIAGALGQRHALHGYSGRVPERVAVGDRLNLLNMGGVIGAGASPVPGLGAPHEVEVLGAVLDFTGIDRSHPRAASIADHALPLIPPQGNLPPVLLLVGTSMDSGKTTAAATLISGLVRRGMRVAAGKLTGVSLRRDILQMADSGADPVCLFTDFGVVTSDEKNGPPTSRAILGHLAESEPDLIVLEMGDGLLGPYGVQAILQDPVMRNAIGGLVLCAQDPVGCWGAVQWLADHHQLRPDLVSGPVTDTPVGRDFCRDSLGLSAHNALLDGAGLVEACCTMPGIATLSVQQGGVG